MRGELIEQLRHQGAVEIDVVFVELRVDALCRERRLEIVGEKPQLRMRAEVGDGDLHRLALWRGLRESRDACKGEETEDHPQVQCAFHLLSCDPGD